jgi:hypothetical protein
MLAVHWSPVKNTKIICKNGIRKDARGVFCFPLTGHFFLDRWWPRAFRTWTPGHAPSAFNGFVFRLTDEDCPAYFGHWGAEGAVKPLQSVAAIQQSFRETLIWRIGEAAWNGWVPCTRQACRCEELGPARAVLADIVSSKRSDAHTTWNGAIEDLGQAVVRHDPRRYTDCLMQNVSFLQFVFEDFEIVLSHSITPHRILKIMPGGHEFGRSQYQRKKHRTDRQFYLDDL